MRIVARLHGFPPAHNAGAEHMLAPMLTALAARGHTAEVHLSQPPTGRRHPWTLDGVRVFLPGTASRARPDVLVSHLENVRVTAAAARGQGIPLVIVLQNSHARTLADLEFAAPALTVANSQWMALRIPRDCLVVRPPVDPALYATTPGTAVTLINLTGAKGGHLFWAIARKMPGTEFLGVEGAYGEQVIPVGGLPNVTVLDAMDGRLMRDEVYARTRILLVPSDYESWSRSATEAMCSGIPVIAHKAEGALAENLGDAAIWADRDDLDAWAAEIRRLSDPAAWEAASEAACKRSAELDPAGELERWCAAVEALVP